MFHFEDTTCIEEVEATEDRLIILDGTARLDYLGESYPQRQQQEPGFLARIKKFFR